jgi:hypothetical protein
VTLERDETGMIVAECPAIPGCVSQGRTEEEALASLATNLHCLRRNRHLILADQEKEFILARLDVPGSIYETLEQIQNREVSYAEMSHSSAPVPGTDHPQRKSRKLPQNCSIQTGLLAGITGLQSL